MRASALTLIFLGACTQAPSSPTPETAPAAKVAPLTVNGRPISEAEITLRMHERGPRGPSISREAAIERVTELELQAQAAEREGLHQDPAFLSEMEAIEARTHDARRYKLAKHYRMRALDTLQPASDAEVEAFIEAHRDSLGTQVTVQRISATSEAQAEAVLAAVRGGQSFEAAPHPVAGESLQLGPLGFDAVPEPWRAALDSLAPGEISGVVPTGDNLFVVLRLVERLEVPVPEPAALKLRVQAVLHARAYEARQEKMMKDLREAATITVKP